MFIAIIVQSTISNDYINNVVKTKKCTKKFTNIKTYRALDELLNRYLRNSSKKRNEISWNNGPDGPWSMGCDFYGNDLSNVRSTGEACSSQCRSKTGCTHYSWTNYNGGTCWMKQGSISKESATKAQFDVVCGVLAVDPIKWINNGAGVLHALNCDFDENNLFNVQSSSKNCSTICKNTPGCTHYSWSNYMKGTCWMKQGPVNQSDAFKKEIDDIICGIITNFKKPSPLLQSNLLWSDEFDDDLLSEWIQETGGHGWGNRELQFYTDKNRNARVENGFLIITARREKFDKNDYTSARLISKRTFKYGIIEARLKIPPGRGTWPAFWMLSSIRPINWPNDGEMDLMEHWGCDPGVVLANIHTKKYNHMIGTNKGNGRKISNLFDDFHTYKLDWNSERMIFYVDNYELFRYENSEKTYEAWPYDGEFNILLNLAVHNMKCNGDVDENAFPANYIIDYVRLYRN